MKYFFVAEEPSMGLPLASMEESGLKTLVNEVVTQAASTGQKKGKRKSYRKWTSPDDTKLKSILLCTDTQLLLKNWYKESSVRVFGSKY